MTSVLTRTVGVTSKLAPGLGGAIAEGLWFRPRGRTARGLPEGAEPFGLTVEGRDLTGFTIGSGEPVLLLHGWGGVASDMAPIATAVAATGQRAIALDLPGHGSDRGGRSDLFRMSAAISAVGAMYGSPVAVVAHSFGAAAAFTAFSHGGPKQVVLIAPAIRSERFFDWFSDFLGLGDRAKSRFVRRIERFAGPLVLAIMRGEGDIPGAEMLILHDPTDERTAYADSVAFAGHHPATRIVPIDGPGHRRILGDERTIAEVVEFLS